MSEEVNKRIRCGECGNVLSEASDSPLDERASCPKCGSKARHFEIIVGESLQLHSQIEIKARHGDTGRPFLESKTGDDLHEKTGQWNYLERVVDREQDYYKELISNPSTGEVIHHCEEPLSKHIGHGSDKERSVNPDDA